MTKTVQPVLNEAIDRIADLGAIRGGRDRGALKGPEGPPGARIRRGIDGFCRPVGALGNPGTDQGHFLRGQRFPFGRHAGIGRPLADQFEQVTAIRVSGNDGSEPGVASLQGRSLPIQPKTAPLSVGTVTFEAVFFENGLNLGREFDGGGGGESGGEHDGALKHDEEWAAWVHAEVCTVGRRDGQSRELGKRGVGGAERVVGNGESLDGRAQLC